jgi:Outer membrane efflux protein
MKSQSLNCHGADRIRMRLLTVSIALQVLLCPFACVCAAGNELPELTRPLDKVEALNLAVARNGAIREARKEVEAAAGIATVRALELATDRYKAGAGTQIDAQTALAEARGSYVDALRNYSVARATLIRATGADVNTEPLTFIK